MDIVSVDIHKGRIRTEPDSKQFYIDKETKNSSSSEKLFNFIVNSVAMFIKDRKITKKLFMGFTFPFPMKHESIRSGELVRWTREFNATGADNRDVVFDLLKAAFDNYQRQVHVRIQ